MKNDNNNYQLVQIDIDKVKMLHQKSNNVSEDEIGILRALLKIGIDVAWDLSEGFLDPDPEKIQLLHHKASNLMVLLEDIYSKTDRINNMTYLKMATEHVIQSIEALKTA